MRALRTRYWFFLFKCRPSRKVDEKIRIKGIQVPIGLKNISKLRFINKETTKKSRNITTATKIKAVFIGEV